MLGLLKKKRSFLEHSNQHYIMKMLSDLGNIYIFQIRQNIKFDKEEYLRLRSLSSNTGFNILIRTVGNSATILLGGLF